MKKETLREKIWDLTMLYSTAREEGDDEEHKLVVNEILQLVEEEKAKQKLYWFDKYGEKLAEERTRIIKEYRQEILGEIVKYENPKAEFAYKRGWNSCREYLEELINNLK